MRLMRIKAARLFNYYLATFGFSSGCKLRRGIFSFLICGAGRGGTSLLTGMLDYHDQIEADVEYAAVNTLTGAGIPVREPRMMQRRVQGFMKACEEQAARFPDKFYGNKITTEQLMALNETNAENGKRLDVLQLFFNRYLAGIKIIFILRDGRTCVRSKIARTGLALEEACKRWNDSVEIYKFFRARHHTNICIRYEDLVATPEKVLAQVCAFLGVELQPAMLRGTANEKLRTEYRRDSMDASKLKLGDVENSCMELIGDNLRYCGYINGSTLVESQWT